LLVVGRAGSLWVPGFVLLFSAFHEKKVDLRGDRVASTAEIIMPQQFPVWFLLSLFYFVLVLALQLPGSKLLLLCCSSLAWDVLVQNRHLDRNVNAVPVGSNDMRRRTPNKKHLQMS
jgi:hypothetical protein